MSKKYKIIFSAIVVAFVAIIVGVCFVFFGNKSIKVVPNSLEVQVVEGEYFLVAEYNGEFEYEFKLEKYIDEDYMTIQTVQSKINTISLSDCNFNIDYGTSYRFSARYTNEDGKGKSEFCESVVWTPSERLQTVDYLTAKIENGILTWNAVPDAHSYTVFVVGADLQSQSFSCQEEECDLNGLKVGKYTAYIVANNEDFSAFSERGEGISFVVERKNIISNATLVDINTLTLTCSEEVERFEVYVGEDLVGYLSDGVLSGGQYTFSNCSVLFEGVDFESSQIWIKSLKNGYSLESELTLVEVGF